MLMSPVGLRAEEGNAQEKLKIADPTYRQKGRPINKCVTI
jgi:hypothetical protein